MGVRPLLCLAAIVGAVVALAGGIALAASSQAAPITVDEGAGFSGVVVHFTGTGPLSSATIDWGDGQSSAGTISQPFATDHDISGSHTWAEEGTYTVTVTATGRYGSYSGTATATVNDAPLNSAGTSVTVTMRDPTAQIVASFGDADPGAQASDYRATIDWGDGSSSAGTVSAQATGGFAVSAGHAYANPGTYQAKVAIADAGGATTAADTTVRVVRPSSAPPQNPPPAVPAFRVPAFPHAGQKLQFKFAAQAPGGDKLAYFAFRFGSKKGVAAHAPTTPTTTPHDTLGPYVFPGVSVTGSSGELTHDYKKPGKYSINAQAFTAAGGSADFQTLTNVDPCTSDKNSASCLSHTPPTPGVLFASGPGGNYAGATFTITPYWPTGQESTTAAPSSSQHPQQLNQASMQQQPATSNSDPEDHQIIQLPSVPPTHKTYTWKPSAWRLQMSDGFDTGQLAWGDSPQATHAFASGGTFTGTLTVTADRYSGQKKDYTTTVSIPTKVVVGPGPICGSFQIAGFQATTNPDPQTGALQCLVPMDAQGNLWRSGSAGIDIGGADFTGGSEGCSGTCGIDIDLNNGHIACTVCTGLTNGSGSKVVNVSFGAFRSSTWAGFDLSGQQPSGAYVRSASGGVLTLSMKSSPGGPTTVGGLPIKSAQLSVPQSGPATMGFTVQLPPAVFPGDQTAQVSGLGSDAASDPSDAQVTLPPLPSLQLGGLPLQNVQLAHNADGSWSGTADVVLPSGLTLGSAQLSLNPDGSFAGLAGDYSGPPLPVPLGSVFLLTHVKFSAGLHPTTLSGGVGIDSTFQLPGVGSLVSIDGCLTLVFSAASDSGKSVPLCDNPGFDYVVPSGGEVLLRAAGSLNVLGFPFAGGAFDYHSAGPWADFAGSFNYDVADIHILTVSGSIAGQIYRASQWLAEAGANVCVSAGGTFDIGCAGGKIAVSSVGISGCASPPWPAPDAGGYYDWGGGFGLDNLFLYDCSFGHLEKYVGISRVAFGGLAEAGTALAHASAATNFPVGVPAGQERVVIGAQGEGGSPQQIVTGPHGVRVADNGQPAQLTATYQVFHEPAINATYVILHRPAAGRWQVAAAPGSPALTTVHRSLPLAKPKIVARVTGHGHARLLRYTVSQSKGQVVTFEEVGKHAGRVIGVAHGASGTIAFAPADGPAGQRAVVADVVQDGVPEESVTVGRYSAPGPLLLPKPVLKLRATRGTLTVAWTAVGHAARYQVRVAVGDGRGLVYAPGAKARSVTVSGYDTSAGARVTVAAVSTDGRAGRPASAALKPTKPRKNKLTL